MDLEAEKDRLYQLPNGEFVAERNKLAKELRRSGDRAAAEEIAKLVRPSPIAWAINQLHFRARPLLDALFEAGRDLRRAQEKGSTSEGFAACRRSHQDALRIATDRALLLAGEAGLASNASSRRRIELNLTSLSAADIGAGPVPGRLSAELEPLGFDALTAAAPIERPKPRPTEVAADVARMQELAALKDALDAAGKEVRRLEQEAKRTEAHYERVKREAEEAEQRAQSLRRSRDEARSETDAIQVRLNEARAQLEHARLELERLSTSAPKPPGR